MPYYHTTYAAISMACFRDIESNASVADATDSNRIYKCGCESMVGDNTSTMLHLCDFHRGFEAAIQLSLGTK